MSLNVDPVQQARLEKGEILPVVLIDMEAQGKTLRFCTDAAITVSGNLYQPFLNNVGTLLTQGSFPENQTQAKEYQLEFQNTAIRLEGTEFDHLSQTFDSFYWDRANVGVSLLLKGPDGSLGESIPLVTSGVGGTPNHIKRDSFLYTVATRNATLNDQITLRPVTQDDFPEADRDELTGRTFLPIIIGSGVRVPASATAAGATTTVTEEVSTGTTLKVSETTGFSNGDDIILNGFVNDPLTIGTVDSANSEFTGLSPNLSTIGQTIKLGTIVRENKAAYDYTVADHECGAISEVRVFPRGSTDPVVIDSSLYSKQTVTDSKAIGGKRTDLRITEIIPFGESVSGTGSVDTQPVHTVNGGNHNHAVSVTQSSTSIHFAGGTTPGGASNVNDGNETTLYALTAPNVVTWDSHPSLGGVLSSQRYFAIVENVSYPGGDWRMRRGTTNFLTVTSAHAVGEFRSTSDTGGSATSDWNIINNESSGNINIHEGWKTVTTNPSVSETTQNLSNTTRTADVAISVDVSGADIEIGDKVEVVIDGALVDDTGRFGNVAAEGTAIQRPDGVMRWILEEALGQTAEIIDLGSYSEAASQYADNDIRMKFAVQEPMKLNRLFDTIADNSASMHYWGRGGHTLHFLTTTGTPIRSFEEDSNGVIDITWDNNDSALLLRNQLVGFYGKSWVRTLSRDEDYGGQVTAEDTDSQTSFGVLGNEVDEGTKAVSYFFDFTPSEAQAQLVLDAILRDKKQPSKVFEIQTDWTYMNIQPGDVVDVVSPTLASGVRTRVLENVVDPHFFCRIRTKEIGT